VQGVGVINGVVNHGVDAAVLLQMLQAQQQQTQALTQALELMQKQAADREQREAERAARPDSRPLPEFKGKPFAGEPSTLESWIREARMQVARLAPSVQATPRAVDFVAQAFTGPALVWFVHELGAAAKPSSPEGLFTLMFARFQPKLAAEDARDQLFALAQGKMTMTEYSTRFRELLALLPQSSFDEATRMQMFRRGLGDAVQSIVVQAMPQPASMEELVELATRVESRAQSGSKRTGASVAVADVEQPGASQAILAALSSISQQLAAGRGPQGGNKGRSEGQPAGKGGFKGRAHSSDDPLNAQSPEQRKKLMEKQLCFYCAQPGHRRPDCPVAARGAPPTPAALGN
jgi:hypothetical protein